MNALPNRFVSGALACVVVSLGIAAGLVGSHFQTMRWIGLSASIVFGPITGIMLALHDGEFTSAATWALSLIAPIALFRAFFKTGRPLHLVDGFVTWLLVGLVLTLSSAI